MLSQGAGRMWELIRHLLMGVVGKKRTGPGNLAHASLRQSEVFVDFHLCKGVAQVRLELVLTRRVRRMRRSPSQPAGSVTVRRRSRRAVSSWALLGRLGYHLAGKRIW